MSNYFQFGIFNLTRLSSRTCAIGTVNDNQEGNGLVERTKTQETIIIIPSYAKDESGKLFRVVETNKYCFRGCSSIESVTLPDTLIKIGYDSFYDTSIESLVIPSSVTTLSSAAFSTMKKAKTITFQPGPKVSTLKWATFANCNLLTTIILPPSIKFIDYGFNRSVALKSVYYCGSHDLSSADMQWSTDNVVIYVTSNYRQSKFGGRSTLINNSVCLPYLYYHSRRCSCSYQFRASTSPLLFITIIS